MPSFSPDEARLRSVLALRQVPGIGDVGSARLLRAHGDAGEAMEHVPVAQRAAAWNDADTILAALRRIGAEGLDTDSPRYPARLRELADAPPVIFARGTLATAHPPAVAIVGTRNASAYGVRVATALATARATSPTCSIGGSSRPVTSG